jgi:hypothetical protein
MVSISGPSLCLSGIHSWLPLYAIALIDALMTRNSSAWPYMLHDA